AEPVADDPDVVALRAAGFRAAVDAVAAACDQVVLDQLVRLDAEVLEQADRVGLVEVHEDGVVLDRERSGAAVDRDAVDVVAGLEADAVDVVVRDEPGTDLDAGRGMPDVVADDLDAGSVAVDVL